MSDSRTVLLCVDVQNGFIRDPEVERVAARIVELARSGDYDELWATRFVNPGPEGPFHRWMQWYRFHDGDEETALWPPLAALEPRVFDKFTYGPPPALLEVARGIEPGQIHITGVDTEACVLATAVRLFDAGVPPHVIVEACASGNGIEAHCAGVESMKRILGPRSVVEDRPVADG